MSTIIAIDPGNLKCGLVVLADKNVIHRDIIERPFIADSVVKLIEKYNIDIILIGNGTGSKSVITELSELTNKTIIVVDELNTTLRAKKLYFYENPPKGLLRIIPVGLLTPKEPYDDYAALIIAQDYLKNF